MATTPLVTVPESAVLPDRISMSAVIDHHAPELTGPRTRLFEVLSQATRQQAAGNELLRLAAAEITGCRLCRNLRDPQAAAEGVDETVVDAVRRGDTAGMAADLTATVELGRRYLGRPSEEPGCADDIATLGPERVATHVMALAKATAFGKTLVALGVEPESMAITSM